MVRAKRNIKVSKPRKSEQYDEDDPRAYSHMPEPDKTSSQFTKDKIDEYHDEKIANLLARGVQMESDEDDLDDEEEVMPLDDSESEEQEEEEEENEEEETDMESDLDGKKDEDLPNELAWGTKKKMFYDSDYVVSKGKTNEELEAEEQEEEEEAINIQKRLAANLSEEDYDLNFFEGFAEEENKAKASEKQERIVKDLKQMSHKEKMKLLKKESPELLELIQDFKAKLSELKSELQPLVQMVKDGKIPAGKGADYLVTKQQLYLNYCTNISFYLVLKAKRIPAHNHPVIERLLTYRNLINDLRSVDARLSPEFRKLLSGDQETTNRAAESKKTKVSDKEKKDSDKTLPEAEDDSDSDLDEEVALNFYREMEKRVKLKRKKNHPEAEEFEDKNSDDEQLDPDNKRGITYQMAKNKGLTPKRKKIDRNPRVKHREKFRRAKIRRKGQVRDVRREEQRYSGEMSGIRAGVKKSTKLK